jgi:hypothetical protein
VSCKIRLDERNVKKFPGLSQFSLLLAGTFGEYPPVFPRIPAEIDRLEKCIKSMLSTL